ncbi:MAG: hypothetical protein QXV23_04985 [Candidatus Bathyarchaeia archaeon]
MLYLVEFHFHGLGKSVCRIPEERVLTAIYRLGRRDRGRFQYFKVKFYRLLSKYKVMKIREKYIVHERSLIHIERGFREIYDEFSKARMEAYQHITSRWDEIASRLAKYGRRFGIPAERILSLKPGSIEEFLEINYSITPLPLLIDQMNYSAEQLEKLGGEYGVIAGRVRREVDEIVKQIREQYKAKIDELEETVRKLRKALRDKTVEAYELKIKAGRIATEAEDITPLLGQDESVELMKSKLEALKKTLTTHQNINSTL